jgi:two-component system, cell cycle sensor histidine kinase DivJ
LNGSFGLRFVQKLKGQIINLASKAAPNSSFEKMREGEFVLRQLLNSLATGAMALAFLVTHGTPALSDAILFIWLMLPFSVVLIIATGKLLPGEVMSSLSFIAAGVTTALGGGALRSTAYAWLILAAIESGFSANAALVAAIGALAALATLLLGISLDATYSLAAEAVDAPAFLVPAIIFAVNMGCGFTQFRTLRHETQRARTQYYDSLAETMDCLIVGCDQAGVVSSVSSNCEALFGLTPGELMGRGFFEHVHVADRPVFLNTISDARAGSATVTTTVRWRGCGRVDRVGYAEPVFLWLEMRARRGSKFPGPLIGDEEDGITAIFRDVSEAKVRVATPERPLATGEPDCAKEYFLAHACHELREPLTAITGFSELLADPQLAPPDREKQREYASVIHKSGRHLLAVVDSILNASMIGSGTVPIDVERFAVAPLIDLCCDMVKFQAENSGVELLRAYQANLDEIIGNRRLFTQIVVNLLSNAIKFTPPPGSVTISARLEASSLHILVTDTGIGISANDLGRLGDPFFRAKGLSERQDKGTGLGLSIVRRFVGVLGGTIVVASEPGNGTCVHVRLPLDCDGFAAKARVYAEIETMPRLLGTCRHDLHKPMMVKKIA